MPKFEGQVFWDYQEPQKEEESGVIRRVVGDTAVDAARGVVSAGESAVGLGNLATGGLLGRGLDAVGYDPQRTHEAMSDFYSPERKRAEYEVAQAEGWYEKGKAALRNPSTIAGMAVQSAPSMLGGAAGARMLGAPLQGLGLSARGAAQLGAAAGEGLVTAGSLAEGVRQEGGDYRDQLAAVPAGLVTGGIGLVSNRFGGGIEAALGSKAAKLEGSLLGRTGKAIAAETGEEFLQSGQEQMWQNAALRQDIMQGVGEQAVMGGLAGGLTGGVVAPFAGKSKPKSLLPDGNLGQDEADKITGKRSSAYSVQYQETVPEQLGMFPGAFAGPQGYGQVNQQSPQGLPGGGDLLGPQSFAPGAATPSARMAAPAAGFNPQGAGSSGVPFGAPGVPLGAPIGVVGAQPPKAVKPAKPAKPAKPEETVNDDEIKDAFEKYAVETTTPRGGKAFIINGKTYYRAEHARSVLSKLAAAEREKDPVRRQAETALGQAIRELHKNALSEGGQPLTPHTFAKHENITDGAASIEEVADRINAERVKIGGKNTVSAQVTMDLYDIWLDKLGLQKLEIPKTDPATGKKPRETKLPKVLDLNLTAEGKKPSKTIKQQMEQKAAETAEAKPGLNKDSAKRAVAQTVSDALATSEKTMLELYYGEHNQNAESLGRTMNKTGEAVRKQITAIKEKVQTALTKAGVSAEDVAAYFGDRKIEEADANDDGVAKLDENDLFGSEEGGAQRTMAVVESIGKSQSNTGKKDLNNEEIQALESGDPEKIAKAVEKAKKTNAKKKAEVLEEAGKGREVKEKELTPSKPRVQRVKKNGEIVTAEEKPAAVATGEQEGQPVDMSQDVAAVSDEAAKATDEDKARDKAKAGEVKTRTGMEGYAASLWDGVEADGKPKWDELAPEVQTAWVDAVKEGRTNLADMSLTLERYGPKAQPSLKDQLAALKESGQLKPSNSETSDARVAARKGTRFLAGAIETAKQWFDGVKRANDLADTRAFKAVWGVYEKLGIAATVTSRISDVIVTDQLPDRVSGQFHSDTRALFINSNETAEVVAAVLAHESGHAVDINEDGSRRYSSDALWSVTVDPVTREVSSVGAIADEIVFSTYTNQELFDWFQYPLNKKYWANKRTPVGNPDAKPLPAPAPAAGKIQKELFAQAWALFVMNPDVFGQHFPITNAFFQRVVNENQDSGRKGPEGSAANAARASQGQGPVGGSQRPVARKGAQARATSDHKAFHGNGLLDVIQKFSTRFVGTGEGNRAFGWGLYFADLKSIAQWYRDMLAGPPRIEYFHDGKRVDNAARNRNGTEITRAIANTRTWQELAKLSFTPEQLAKHGEQLILERMAAAGFDGIGEYDIEYTRNLLINENRRMLDNTINAIEKDLERQRKRGRTEDEVHPDGRMMDMAYLHKWTVEGLERADSSKITIKTEQSGKLYTVEIDIAPEHYFNWHDTIDSQSDYVKEALKKAFGIKSLSSWLGDEGGQFYTEQKDSLKEYLRRHDDLDPTATQYRNGIFSPFLVNEHGPTYDAARAVSLAMKEAGIPGLRYEDNTSRGKKDVATYNYVVFDEDRVKIEAHESRSTMAAPKLPSTLQEPVNAITDNIGGLAKNGLLASMFGHDLADLAANHLKSARKYFDLLGEKGAKKNHLETKVQKIMERFTSLDKATRDAANRFIEDSTTKGLWAYKPAWDGTVEVDEAMKARFDALNSEARDVIKAVFQHGHDVLVQKRILFNKALTATYDAQIKALEGAEGAEAEIDAIKKDRAEAIRLYGRTFAELKGPYAPLRRSGEFVVTGRSKDLELAEKAKDTKTVEKLKQDENHYVVRFVHTEAQAKKLERDLAKQMDGKVEWSPREVFVQSNVPRWQELAKIRDRAVSYFGGDSDTSKAMAASFNRIVGNMYLHALSEASARKSEMRRRNIAGYDEDMMHSFENQGRADAHLLASMEKNEEINQALMEMAREAKEGGDRGEKMRLRNEILRRHEASMNYVPANWQDVALRGTSFWMLTTSPAYFFQNMTQAFMLTLPVLNGRFGTSRAWGALLDGYRDLRSLAKESDSLLHLNLEKIPNTNERAALQRLVDLGIIDIGIEQDFGDPDAASGVVSKTFNTVTSAAGRIARRVEVINRVSSALAAYRLHHKESIAAGKTEEQAHAAAVQYAGDVIRQTHGDYSAFNAPRILQSGAFPGIPIRLIGQFRKFQIIQISLLARLYRNAFHDADPEVRAVAKKQLAWTLGHTFTMAGALGSPLFPLLAKALAWAFGDPEDDEEAFLRKAIGNKALSDLLLRGAPAALGVNVSGKLGMGQTFSLLPFLDTSTLEGKDAYAATLMAISGPFLGGLLPRAVQGASLIGEGNYYKGMEMLLPKGLADAAKAFRFATEGITSRRGDTYMTPEELNFADIAAQGLGLPTMKVTERGRQQRRVIEVEQGLEGQASDIKLAYLKAVKNRDAEGMKRAREDWEDLQKARVRNGFARQPLSNLLKAPYQQQKRERNTTKGGLQFSKRNRKFVEETEEL